MVGTVTGSTPIEYRAWLVPDHAVHVTPPGRRQDGWHLPVPKTNVQDLSQADLDALAQAWVDALYQRAGKPAPKLTRAE